MTRSSFRQTQRKELIHQIRYDAQWLDFVCQDEKAEHIEELLKNLQVNGKRYLELVKEEENED